MAAASGEAIGAYAARILDTDLPWTKMRAVYALIGLCRTYGNGPVEQACAAALELDVISVSKIRSIVEKGTGAQAAQAAARSRQADAAAGKVLAAQVRPRPAGVRDLDRGPDAGPARRRRLTPRFIFIRFITPVSFHSFHFISFRRAPAWRERTRSTMTITDRPPAMRPAASPGHAGIPAARTRPGTPGRRAGSPATAGRRCPRTATAPSRW